MKELVVYRKENAAHYKEWYELEPYYILPEFLVTLSDMTGTRTTTCIFDGEDFMGDDGTPKDVIAWSILPPKYDQQLEKV